MKTRIFCLGLPLGLLLGLGRPATAQGSKPEDFYANIVKIAGSKGSGGQEPQYGFVTGTGPDAVYFVLLSKNRKFLETHQQLRILHRSKKDNRSAEATQVGPNAYAAVGDYYLALFRIAGTFAIQRSTYRALRPTETEGYHLIWDAADAAEDSNFKPHYGGRERDEIGQVEGQRAQHAARLPVRFEVQSATRGALARAGMPLFSRENKLVGVVAENQDEAQRKFDVLPMLAVRAKLASLGKTLAGGECAYFNLLEDNHAETVCDSLTRMEALHRQSVADQAAYWATLKKDERQVIRHDKNYLLAISLGGGGHVNYVSFSTGTDNNTNQLGVGYSYGLNLHLSPDKGGVRLTLKPRYAAYTFFPPTNYNYPANTSGFVLKQMRVTTVELPAMLEFGVKRSPTRNSYLALGYGYGQQRGGSLPTLPPTSPSAPRSCSATRSPPTSCWPSWGPSRASCGCR